MADKGIDIKDLLAPLGVKFHLGIQFLSDNALHTKKLPG